MPNGYTIFAALAGSRIALTSADGRALETFDVPDETAGGDFVVDPNGRFEMIYSRLNGSFISTVAQIVGVPLGPRKRALR